MRALGTHRGDLFLEAGRAEDVVLFLAYHVVGDVLAALVTFEALHVPDLPIKRNCLQEYRPLYKFCTTCYDVSFSNEAVYLVGS